MPEENKSFWTSIPGILTGLAGVITAVTGLYVVMVGKDHTLSSKQPPSLPAEPVSAGTLLTNKDTSGQRSSTDPERRFVLKAIIDDPDGYTNVRSMKSASSDLVTKVYQNEEFYTYMQEGDWWQIKTKDGKVGYMHVSRIRIVKDK